MIEGRVSDITMIYKGTVWIRHASRTALREYLAGSVHISRPLWWWCEEDEWDAVVRQPPGTVGLMPLPDLFGPQGDPIEQQSQRECWRNNAPLSKWRQNWEQIDLVLPHKRQRIVSRLVREDQNSTLLEILCFRSLRLRIPPSPERSFSKMSQESWWVRHLLYLDLPS
jgi:hypothetical protein